MSSKPTPGAYRFDHDWERSPTLYGEGGFQEIARLEKNAAMQTNPGPVKPLPGREANASLMLEAFTVHHETGLTPQQLREQRDELLAAAKLALTVIGGNAARDALEAAIAKVEGRS